MKRLEEVLSEIGEAIEVVRSFKCDSLVSLLEMAELELRMKVHNVSEIELAAFCRELEWRFNGDGARRSAEIIELRPRQARAGRGKH